MLEGVRAHPIIVGAYVDRDGGMCPMLAAHRHGGRTNFVSFARAWDRFARAPLGRTSRRATEREVRVLIGQLEASIGSAEPRALDSAITEHQALSRDRRSREAAGTGGWGWLRRRGTEQLTPEPEHLTPEPALAASADERERELVS